MKEKKEKKKNIKTSRAKDFINLFFFVLVLRSWEKMKENSKKRNKFWFHIDLKI